jgi:hypothetical protein
MRRTLVLIAVVFTPGFASYLIARPGGGHWEQQCRYKGDVTQRTYCRDACVGPSQCAGLLLDVEIPDTFATFQACDCWVWVQ